VFLYFKRKSYCGLSAGQSYLTAPRFLIAVSLPPLLAGIDELNAIALIFEAARRCKCHPSAFQLL